MFITFGFILQRSGSSKMTSCPTMRADFWETNKCYCIASVSSNAGDSDVVNYVYEETDYGRLQVPNPRSRAQAQFGLMG
jgi:hypothetical protein